MDLIVKFLFLSGKYITCAAGKTILELVNQSVKIHRHVSRKYEQLTQMVGPYDNMLELFNARIEDNPLHYLAMPACSSCNQSLAPSTYTEVPRTLTVPCSYECESEDLLAQEHQQEEVGNDEYEQIYQDLYEDLHKSSMELQNEMQDNQQATAEFAQTFIPLYDDSTDEVHDVPSHDTITTFHFIPKKQSPETPKHHHNSIPVHHFFRSRLYSDCSQDSCADVCNLGLVSMCDRYAHMNHLLTDAPDDSYFKKNAFITQSENPKVDSNTGMYNLRTILLHPIDMVGKGSNEAIENDYKDEITHRTFVIKKNCDDCIDKFRDNVAATALRSPQKCTSQQSRSFDAKLRNKILGIISRNMSSSNFKYDMDLEDICDDLMNRVKQETKLIRINETAFNKLEQKVTQFLISQSWKDIEKVFARGRREKNVNTEEIKKLTFDEINSNTSVRIRDAVVASKNKKRTKENRDDKSSSMKFATLAKEKRETTGVLLNTHSKNANEIFTKLKHLETLSKELDSFCSLENIEKIPITQHDTLRSILLAPLPEIASPIEVVTPSSKTMDQANMVDVSTETQLAAKNETTKKTGLTDFDIENMRERSKIIDSNMKAFRIFEDNLKKVVILDKPNEVKGGPKVMKEEELTVDKNASSNKNNLGGKMNENVLDYMAANKISSPTVTTRPNNVTKIVLPKCDQPKSDFIVTNRQKQETPIIQMKEHVPKIGDNPTDAIIRQSKSDFKRTYVTGKGTKDAIRTKKVNSEEEEHRTDEMECRENIDMLNKELYNNQPDEVDNSVSDLIARLWDKPSTRVSLESSVYVDANTLMFPQSSDAHSTSQADDSEYPNEDDVERSQQNLQPGFTNRLKKRSASDTAINTGKKKKVLINIYVSNTSVCNKVPVVKAAENLVSVLKTSQSITQLMKKNQSSISNFEDDQIDEKEVSLNTASKQILIDVERVWKMQQSLKPSVNVEKLHVDTDRLSTVQQSLESAVEPVLMEPAACPKIDVEKFYRMQQHLTPTMPTARAFSVRDSVTTAPLAQKIVDTFDRSTTMHDAAKDSGHFVESMFGQYGHFFQPYLGIYASKRLDDKVKGVMSEHVTSRTKAIVDPSITKQHSMNDFKIDYELNNKLNSISFKDHLKKERSHYLETGSSNASTFISKFDNDNKSATTYPISDTKVDDTSKDLMGGQSNSKGNLRQLPLIAANTWNYNAISSAEMKHQDQESNDQNLEPSKSQHTMKTKNIKLKYDTNSKEISQVVFNADTAGDTDIFDTITENATALLNKFQGSKNNNSSSSSSSVSKRPPREENDQSTLRKMFDFLPNENLGFAEPTEEPLVITNKYTKPTEDLAISDAEKPLYQRLLAFLPVNKSNSTTCSLQQVRPKSDSGKNDDIDKDIDYIMDKDIDKISKKRNPNDEEANRRKLRANEKQRPNRYESKANEIQEDTDKALQDYYNERKRAKLRDLGRDDIPVIRDTQTPRETREYVRMKKTNDSYDDQDTPDEIDPRKTAFSYEKYKEAYRDKIERSKKYDAEIKQPASNPKLDKRMPEKKAKFCETEDSDGDLYKNLQRSLTRKKSKGTNDENKRYDASNDLKLKYYQPKPMAVREQFPKTPLSSPKQEKEPKEKHSSGRHQNDNFDHRYNRKLANTQDDTPDVYVKEYESESPPQAKKRPEYHTVAPQKSKPMANGDNHDQTEVYENRKDIRRDRAPRRTNREYTRADEQQLMDKRPINGTGSSNYQWKPLYPTEQKPEGHSDFTPQKLAARPSERRLTKEPKSASQLTVPEEHQKKSYPQTHYSTSNLARNTEDKQEVIGKDDNKVSIKVDINQPKMKKISFEFKPFNPNHLTQRTKQAAEVADQSKPEVQTNQTSTYKVLIKSNDDGEVTPKVEESYEEFQAQYVSKHSSERSGDDKPDQGAGSHVADDISPGPNTPSQKTPKLEYLHRQHSRNEEPRRYPRAKAPDFGDGAPIERQHLEDQQRVDKKSSRRYIEATRERIDTISQYERKGNKTTRDDNSKNPSHQSSDPEELYRRHSKRNLREMQQVYIKPKQRAVDRYQPVRMVENTIPSVSQAPKVEEQHRSQDRLDVESKKPRKFKMPKYSQEEQGMTQSVQTEEHNEPVQRTDDNLKYRPPEKRKAEDSQEETSTSENMTVSQQINQLSQLIQQQQKMKENNETPKSKEYSYQQQEPIKPEPLHQEEIVQENETFMHPIEEEQVVHAPGVKERHQSREVARIASKDHQYAEDERIDERSDYQEEPPIKAFAEESKPHIRVSEDVEPVDNHQPAQKSFEFRPIKYKSTKFEPKLDHSVVKAPPKKLVKSFEYNHMESKIDKEISQDGSDYYKLFHPQISHTPKLTQSQKYYRKMQVAADGMGGNIAPPPVSSVPLPPFKMPQRQPRQMETEEAPEPRQRLVPPIPKPRSQEHYQTEKEMSVEEEKLAETPKVEDSDLSEQPSIQGPKKKPEWRYQAQHEPNTYESFGGVDKSDPAKSNSLLRAVHEKARKHMEERRMLEAERKVEEERIRALEKPEHVTSSETVVSPDLPKTKQSRVVGHKPGGHLTNTSFKFKPLEIPKNYAEVEEPKLASPKPRQAPLELKKVEKKEHGDIRRVFQFKPVEKLDKFGVDKVLPEVEIAESLNNARLEVSSRSKVNKTEEQREALVAEKLAKRNMKDQAPQNRPNQKPPSRPNSIQRSKPSIEFIREEKSDDRKLEGRKTEGEANEKKVTQSPYTHKSLRDHQNAYPRQNTDPQPRPPTTPAVSPKENNISDYVWTNESHNHKHGEARTETSKLKAIITKSIQNTQLRDQQQTNVTNKNSEFDRGQYPPYELLNRSDHRKPSTVQSAFGNARADSPRRPDEQSKTSITAQRQMEMSTATAPMKRPEPEQEEVEEPRVQSSPPKPGFVYSFDHQYRANKSNDSIRKKRFDYWKKLSRIDNWTPVVTDPTIQNELYRPKVILKVQRPEERIAEDQPPLLPEYGPGDDHKDEVIKKPVKPKRSMKELRLEQTLDKRLSNVSPLLKHYLKVKAMAKEKAAQDTPVVSVPSISTAVRRNPPNNTILIEMTPQENIYQKYPLLRKSHNQRDMEELAKREQERIDSEMKAHAEENLIKLEKIKLAAESQPSPRRKDPSYLRDTAVKFKADVDKYSNMMKWKMKYMAHVEKLNAPRRSARKSRENLLVKKFPFLKKFRKVNQVTWPRDQIEHWDAADYAPVRYDLTAVSRKKPWYSEEDEKSEDESSSKIFYEDNRKKYKFKEKEITSKFGKPVKMTYLVDDEEKQ